MQKSIEIMGLTEGSLVKEGYLGDVNKFLNRLLGLKVLEQNKVRSNTNTLSLCIFVL